MLPSSPHGSLYLFLLVRCPTSSRSFTRKDFSSPIEIFLPSPITSPCFPLKHLNSLLQVHRRVYPDVSESRRVFRPPNRCEMQLFESSSFELVPNNSQMIGHCSGPPGILIRELLSCLALCRMRRKHNEGKDDVLKRVGGVVICQYTGSQ